MIQFWDFFDYQAVQNRRNLITKMKIYFTVVIFPKADQSFP